MLLKSRFQTDFVKKKENKTYLGQRGASKWNVPRILAHCSNTLFQAE